MCSAIASGDGNDPCSAVQTQPFDDAVEPVAPRAGCIVRGGAMRVVHQRHARQLGRDRPHHRGPHRVAVDDLMPPASHDAGHLPRGTQVKPRPHRHVIQRRLARLAHGVEEIELHASELHAESALRQAFRQQILNALRAGIVFAVDDVQHVGRVAAVATRPHRLRLIGRSDGRRHQRRRPRGNRSHHRTAEDFRGHVFMAGQGTGQRAGLGALENGDWLHRLDNSLPTNTVSGDGACPLFRRATGKKRTGTVAASVLLRRTVLRHGASLLFP